MVRERLRGDALADHVHPPRRGPPDHHPPPPRRRRRLRQLGLLSLGLLVLACSPAGPKAGPASAPRSTQAPSVSAIACAAAQADAGAPGVTSALPVLVLASGLPTPEDLLMDGDRLLVGEYSTGRVAVVGAGPGIDHLPGTVPEVEGMARLGDTLYVAGQRDDRVVALAADGSVRTVLQLRPVPGVEGLDQIATDGRVLIVPDSAGGTVLWVAADGTIQRSVGGFARPTGAWPVPDGSVLVAEENGGRVWSIAPDGTRTVLASGLALADDVARTPDGRVFAISIGRGGLFEIAKGTATEVATGLAQPQGLELDHAGNPIVTEYDRGRVLKVVETAALRPGSGTAALAAGQPLCVRVARAPGFADPVAIEPEPGYRVLAQPASGVEGSVVPAGCGQPECSVQVRVRFGDRTDAAWLRYRTG